MENPTMHAASLFHDLRYAPSMLPYVKYKAIHAVQSGIQLLAEGKIEKFHANFQKENYWTGMAQGFAYALQFIFHAFPQGKDFFYYREIRAQTLEEIADALISLGIDSAKESEYIAHLLQHLPIGFLLEEKPTDAAVNYTPEKQTPIEIVRERTEVLMDLDVPTYDRIPVRRDNTIYH